MTDKERTEKYLKNNHCNDCMFWDCCYGVENKECVEKTKYIKNHIDGLAEGRKEKWHDLRKNPDDLPKENGHYWCYVDDGVFHNDYGVIYFGNGKWESEKWENKTIILIWCELPKFEEK